MDKLAKRTTTTTTTTTTKKSQKYMLPILVNPLAKISHELIEN
jgi:hypothetical protein